MTFEEYALQLHNGKIRFNDIPDEIRSDINFMRYLRKNKFSKTTTKGYDIIRDVFFANEMYFIKSSYTNEIFEREVEHCFDSFNDLYIFVDGKNLYKNACYYQCTEDRLQLEKISESDRKKIKIKKILVDCFYAPFVQEKSSEFFSKFVQERKEQFDAGKANKPELLRWFDLFCSTLDSYDEFIKVYKSFQKTNLCTLETLIFIFTQVISKDSEERFLPIYYRCKSQGLVLVDALFDYTFYSYYSTESILKYYQYDKSFTELTQNKHKTEMSRFLEDVQGRSLEIEEKFFDTATSSYCVVCGFPNLLHGRRVMRTYLDNFEDFAIVCKNDLSNADLRCALDLDIDLTKYTTNEHTRLPAKENQLRLIVRKEFDPNAALGVGGFIVDMRIVDTTKNIHKKQVFDSKYFFDFIAFLDKDLSDSNLLLCDGLINLHNVDGINLTNAKIRSKCAKKLKLPIVSNLYISEKYINATAEDNENQSLAVLRQMRDELTTGDDNQLIYEQSLSKTSHKIYYISDLHLLHQIENNKCESYDDVVYLLISIAQNLCPIYTDNLIIAGDVSSNFELYRLFVGILKEYCEARNIFFILGNHELWSFPGMTIDEICDRYRVLLESHGMHLLHNNVFVCNEYMEWSEISQARLIHDPVENLEKNVECARLILFGGLGFAGYNQKFNADAGIYRLCLDRSEEVRETAKFYALYEKILPVLKQGNSIVATHMPKRDWSGNDSFESGVVYISGHSHRNFFYDDNETRIYADNQIGYKHCILASKFFYIDTSYDLFIKYPDGIYEITQEDYNNFYNGKSIHMTCSRELNILYMLKRNNYYCFIHKTKSGKLSMFNGGALRSLSHKDINYYYDNMQLMIDAINGPLTQYSNIQKSISRIIKQLGGSGKIHGCIIDIDFYNHIYVNPSNGIVRAYYAEDMVRKLIYPSVPKLIEDQCPELHNTYLKLIESGNQNVSLVLQPQNNTQPVLYLETDIYSASRIVKKMQRIESQILTYWDDNALENYKTKMANQELLQENENYSLIE